MNSAHKSAFQREIALARALMRRGDHDPAFAHLERAHVLGQEHVAPHVLTHWLMLRVELARRQPAAALNQAVRMALAVFGTAIGVVPVGNTGGSNVSMFKRMPIDPDLLDVMRGGGAGALVSVLPAIPDKNCRANRAINLLGYGAALLAGMLIGSVLYAYAPELIRTRSDQPPVNFVPVSERLHTSGQPSRAQLAALGAKGYGLVINLAPPSSIDSIPEEGMLVGGAGITYMNIPTDWNAPGYRDFELFSDVLRNSSSRQVLIHCQLNRRASVFTFLYRVVHEGADPERAYENVTAVWVPDRQWKDFASMVLKRNGVEFELY